MHMILHIENPKEVPKTLLELISQWVYRTQVQYIKITCPKKKTILLTIISKIL